MDRDTQIRNKAFEWLSQQVEIYGDVLPRKLLQVGFYFQDVRIPLVSPQGIFKPRLMELPLSITTTADSPYDDNYSADGFLEYRYRGIDPMHRDNVGLRHLMKRQDPLIYFHSVIKGRYLAIWPVYIVGDNPKSLTFTVAVDDPMTTGAPEVDAVSEITTGRRAYLTTVTKRRLHQRSFREKVLRAYRESCAFCRLKQPPLLDAAHIIDDSHEKGIPQIKNGLALCKLHHAAFDRFILGVSPDYTIKVRHDILKEIDGPLLTHGLQRFDGVRLTLPHRKDQWPDRDALAWKYKRFLKAQPDNQ